MQSTFRRQIRSKCIHTYIHIYIHTTHTKHMPKIHTSKMHTYIHTHRAHAEDTYVPNAYIHTHIHTYIHTHRAHADDTYVQNAGWLAVSRLVQTSEDVRARLETLGCIALVVSCMKAHRSCAEIQEHACATVRYRKFTCTTSLLLLWHSLCAQVQEHACATVRDRKFFFSSES
jgi:hypothetical protein